MTDINPTSGAERKDESVEIKLRSIVKSLRQRTEKVKNYVEQPPTPEDSDDELDKDEEKIVRELILDDFTESRYASKKSLADLESANKSWRTKLRFSGYIDPRGKLNIGLPQADTESFKDQNHIVRMACFDDTLFHLQCLGHSLPTILQALPTTSAFEALVHSGLSGRLLVSH